MWPVDNWTVVQACNTVTCRWSGVNLPTVIHLQIKIATMGDIKSRWQQWSKQHLEGQKLNPFSEDFDYEYAMSQRLQKGDSGYGRPKDGSKTAERGDRAQKHIHREMEEMVWLIRDMGFKDKEGRTVISFGRLFDRYVKISDKVVGILLRCRKHKMLDFEGEMLWKGQDDDVIITLRDWRPCSMNIHTPLLGRRLRLVSRNICSQWKKV